MKLLLALGAAAVALAAAGPARATLTEAPRLAAIYDSILDARFDRADAQMKDACPPAPADACRTLGVVSLWWQILINPESEQLDPFFERAATAAIAANESWTRREPGRAEAWFYLAGAYAPRVQWRILRGQRLAAAIDGKKIKDALERALELDPTLSDAYFGIGLYHYYAGIAPAAAKMLRWLLFLPGGDRAAGLREMLKAQTTGELIRGEADYQLQLLYLWYEQKPTEAITMLERLDARYPYNPIFLEQIADARAVYLHDHASSATTWRTLLARAAARQIYAAPATEVRARLGIATELAAMNQRDPAIEQLKVVIAMRPMQPVGALARAERQLRSVASQKSRP